jgi:transposase InsO family protein
MPEQTPDAPAVVNTTVAGRGDEKQRAKTKQDSSSIKPTHLYAPKDPGQGLAEHEKEAILELKKDHPSYGPAQVRAQLKRFKGWRVSIKAIAKVFRDNGYQLVHRGSRPEGPEPIRFEAPRRNALWQIDFAEMRIVGEKLHLCVALDDFSRYVVGHDLAEHPSSEVAVEVMQNAIARHGKPESLRTDRGGGFLGKEFTDVLEAEVIDHIVGRSYHPQGGGKVESIIGTVRRELWDVEQFNNREHALQRIREFLDDYNERRAHMGIDGLTPADRYFGRGDRVLAAINAMSRNRNGTLSNAGKAFEELAHPSAQTPMEVLRLVLVSGKMELRFCGARVELGSIEGV